MLPSVFISLRNTELNSREIREVRTKHLHDPLVVNLSVSGEEDVS